eukprot:5457762-Pyramimonas_sp.AAC.1
MAQINQMCFETGISSTDPLFRIAQLCSASHSPPSGSVFLPILPCPVSGAGIKGRNETCEGD